MADFLDGMSALVDDEGPLANFVSSDTDETIPPVTGDEPIVDDTIDKDDKDIVDKELDDKENDKTEESSSNTSNSPYSAFVTALGDSLPYLKDDKVDIKNVEEFQEYIDKKLESEIESREFSDLTPDQKKYLEQLRSGVPDEEIKQALTYEQQINSITEEDLEADEKLRENLIYQGFKQDGLSDDKAKRLTAKTIAAGEDIEDAKESLAQLQAGVKDSLEKKRLAGIKQQEESKKAYDAQMQKLKDTIDTPEEVLGSKNLNTKYKKDLYNLITKPQEFNGKEVNFLNKFILEDPVKANIVFGHLYMATDGFKADKIKNLNLKTVKSKVSNELKNVIEQGNFKFNNDSDSNDLDSFNNTG